MPITSWSSTPADNDDADSASGISWPEGMSPAQVNNSSRAMMAVIKTDWDASNLTDLATGWTSTGIGATSTSGALGSASGNMRHKKIGRIVFVEFSLNVVDVGTAGGGLVMTLPYTSAGLFVITGRDVASTGYALVGSMAALGTSLSVFKYDNTFPAVNGSTLVLSGVYEATS